ncbi:MAG: zf-HC2 domain-containing protein [Actinomycetota bacterium]|nr:zf-HC2 domain-containing protein [Actinomycetota bacterium]
MSSPLSHERCSELLLVYVTDELDAEERTSVENHLEHCAQCSAERAGLLGLRSGPAEPLSEDERVVLRASVLAAARGSEPAEGPLADEHDAVIVPLGGRRARAAKYVGIAALLAVLAVGFAYGGFLGGSADDSAGDAGSAAPEAVEGGEARDERVAGQAEGGAESEEEPTTSEAPEAQDDSGDDEIDSGDESEGERSSELVAETEPVFTGDEGDLDGDELGDLAKGRRFRLLNRATSVRVPDEDTDAALEALVESSPAELVAPVNNCGLAALDELDEQALPVYGATATVDGQEAVVIGLVTGESSLDRFLVVAFELDDCTTILNSSEGPIP